MKRAGPTKTAILFTAGAAAFLVALVFIQQRTRTIEGTWIDLFEGSRFFENEDISSACGPRFMDAPWLAYYPKVDSAEGKLIEANRNSGIFVWPAAGLMDTEISSFRLPQLRVRSR